MTLAGLSVGRVRTSDAREFQARENPLGHGSTAGIGSKEGTVALGASLLLVEHGRASFVPPCLGSSYVCDGQLVSEMSDHG